MTKYVDVFLKEGVTMERFEKLMKINHGSFATMMLMERCHMSCGDFIDLVSHWERRGTKERQNQDSNLKRARTEEDMYKTP